MSEKRDSSREGTPLKRFNIVIAQKPSYSTLNLKNLKQKNQVFKRESVASVAKANILKQRKLRKDINERSRTKSSTREKP